MSTRQTRQSADDPAALLKQVIDSANDLGVVLAQRIAVGTTDFRALNHLFESGPLGPHELGRRLGLTSAAATALADRLERAGHVRRERTGTDRRRVALVPTEHARTEAFAALRPFLEDVGAIVEGLGEDERATIAGFLRQVRDVQVAHAAEPPPARPR